jgi:hypothetical protein
LDDGSDLPDFITFDSDTLTFSVFTEDELDIGTYKVVVHALYFDVSVNTEQTFYVIVLDSFNNPPEWSY